MDGMKIFGTLLSRSPLFIKLSLRCRLTQYLGYAISAPSGTRQDIRLMATVPRG